MSANGYLSSNELTTVQGNMQLRSDTARAWFAMKAAAAKNGITLTIAGPAGAYRSREIQLDMRAHPGKYNITPGVVPGLPSDHGWGTEVDIANGQTWAIANGPRFGFTRTKLGYNDPNHYHYDGITPAGGGATPINITEEEQGWLDMAYGYRLMSMDNVIPKTATNPNGTQLVLAEMDPDPLNVAGGHRNVWVEDSLDNRREWVELFGPAHAVGRLDSWNSRSNDPHRINTFPADNIPAASTAFDASALADAISKKLPATITKQDVIDALKSVSYKAS